MKKITTALITFTAIGVAVKVLRNKEPQSVYIHAIDENDAIEGIKHFLISNNKQYLTHEYDLKAQKVFLLFKWLNVK